MTRLRVYQADTFTSQPFLGNPAGVVPAADGLTDRQMQAIASELNNSETAFVFAPDAADHDVRIRFFTPSVEVPSCGHATIAAHYVRAVEQSLGACTVRQKIGIGILPVEVVPLKDDYRIVMTQGRPGFEAELTPSQREDIQAALGLQHLDLDSRCPIEIVTTGHSKVLVGIRNRDVLNALAPDMAHLIAISRQICCNGYFVFVLGEERDPFLTHARMFAPAIGIDEDPVTGNGNGPLGAYLVKLGLLSVSNGQASFKSRQGEAMGRPGAIDVEVTVHDHRPTAVRVSGRAVIAFKADMVM